MRTALRKTMLRGATIALLGAAAAVAQPAALEPAAPKFQNNAEAAAYFKYAKRDSESQPDPNRPAGGNTNTAHPVTNFVPVSDALLRNPDPADWIMARGNYQGWGYSALTQLNKTNVKGLQLAWARMMEPGTNEGTPLIHDGVMFLPNTNNVIQAIDAANGDILWQYRRRLPTLEQLHRNLYGERMRSIALYDDKLYVLTRDNFLIALDARTGKEVWQVNRGGDLYVTNSSGPIVANGIVLAGSECQEAPFACWVDAHDAQTGKLLWRNELIPHPGEPGDETWKGKPFNERWMTDVWGTLTYDPDTNILYYGSSAVGPASEAQRGQISATMAGTNTRFAVDPKTGKVLWKHQVMPEDNWDQDCVFEMMPITTPVHPDAKAEGMFSVGGNVASASRKTLTGMPCKTGILWSFDALTGDYLWSKSTVPQNLVNKIDPKGIVTVNPDMLMRDIDKSYPICPTEDGGRDWAYSAYSPRANVMYFQLQNECSDVKVRIDNVPSLPIATYNISVHRTVAPGKTNVGRIDAINVETGKTAWSWETPVANHAPILATAGGLIFNGGTDRYFWAQDEADGKVLWRTRLGSSVAAAPVTYSVKGKQYVAVAGGGGGFSSNSMILTPGTDQAFGANMVYVFALQPE